MYSANNPIIFLDPSGLKFLEGTAPEGFDPNIDYAVNKKPKDDYSLHYEVNEKKEEVKKKDRPVIFPYSNEYLNSLTDAEYSFYAAEAFVRGSYSGAFGKVVKTGTYTWIKNLGLSGSKVLNSISFLGGIVASLNIGNTVIDYSNGNIDELELGYDVSMTLLATGVGFSMGTPYGVLVGITGVGVKMVAPHVKNGT